MMTMTMLLLMTTTTAAATTMQHAHTNSHFSQYQHRRCPPHGHTMPLLSPLTEHAPLWLYLRYNSGFENTWTNSPDVLDNSYYYDMTGGGLASYPPVLSEPSCKPLKTQSLPTSKAQQISNRKLNFSAAVQTASSAVGSKSKSKTPKMT
eukprot:1109789-Rhodomonas_salina.1